MSSTISRQFVRAFGIEVPIIQGPMAGTSGPTLVAAVANAGGLGMLPVWGRSAEAAKALIAETKALTDGVFGINLRADFKQLDHIRMAVDEGVPVIHVFWGDPVASAAPVRGTASRLVVTVDCADMVKAALDAGAAALIAQGTEAGGHVLSETPLMELLATALDLAGDVPVVAAGGLATADDVADVVNNGAAGALLGTRFAATEESDAHDAYKQALHRAGPGATVRTEVFDIGWPNAPLRCLRNSTFDMWERAGSPPSGQRPGEGDPVMHTEDGKPIPRYHAMAPKRGMEGDFEAAVMYAGMGVGRVTGCPSAGELVKLLASKLAL